MGKLLRNVAISATVALATLLCITWSNSDAPSSHRRLPNIQDMQAKSFPELAIQRTIDSERSPEEKARELLRLRKVHYDANGHYGDFDKAIADTKPKQPCGMQALSVKNWEEYTHQLALWQSISPEFS